MIEATIGLGLLLGPPIGSGFYNLGGYKAPFLAFGKFLYIIYKLIFLVTFYVLAYPFVVYNLYQSEK